MLGCTDCDNSSSGYNRCEPLVSGSCTLYTGDNLECGTFKVCKGQNLNTVQSIIFDKICELYGKLDITTIEFPCSLQTAWEKQDPTILNLLQYIVEVQCTQNTLINTINTQLPSINPEVEVCLKCCGFECGNAKILLSEALDKIVTCLCAVKAQAQEATNQANIARDLSQAAKDKTLELETKVNQLITANISVNQRLTALETKTQCMIPNPEC